MGRQITGLFCLLVCCELSLVLSYRRPFRFGKNQHQQSYNYALRTGTGRALALLTNRKVFNEVDEARIQWEYGLALNVSRKLGEKVRADVPGARIDINNGAFTHTDKTDNRLSWTHTHKGKHMEDPGVYRRPRRAAMTNQSETGSVFKSLESFPKAAAQQQRTEPPGVFPTHGPTFPFPEEDYEDSTPLGPINPRPRAPGLPNPFYPVTGESYSAYAIILVSVIMFTAGIIGNIAIMCAVCHNYYMRSVSNSLLANLALWDFLITFFCLPLVIFHEVTKDWLLGEFSCKIIPYFEVKKK